MDAVHFRSRFWPLFALAALLPLGALAMYLAIGAPPLAPTRAAQEAPLEDVPREDVTPMHASLAATTGQQSGDMQQAIDRLRARLQANPHDASGWRLLAKSYEFIGRAGDAAEANRRADEAARAPATRTGAIADTAPPLAADAAALAARAQEHRRQREFAAANRDFAELARRGQMNADLWADYADSLGGERGALDGEAADCIQQALRLDPDHDKALWLLGSLQTQRGDYRAALATWQRLAALIPADSPDARFIADNITEARGKLGGGAARDP